MKVVLFALVFAGSASLACATPNAIYRCGNEFLNDAVLAQARACSIVESSGAAVTVFGTRVQTQAPQPARVLAASPAPTGSAPVPASDAPKATSWRTDSADQRSRDRDALSILLAELSKAEAQLAERQRELQGVMTEKFGSLDAHRQAPRQAELQSSIGRHLSDIASLKREIGRLPLRSK